MKAKLDDETLREAFASLAEDAECKEDCHDPERIRAAVQGDLPVGERHEIVDHIATCPACAETWRVAHAVFGGPAPVPFVDRLRPWLQSPRVYQLGLAGAAVLILVLAVPGVRLPDFLGVPGPPMAPSGAVAQFRGEITTTITADQALLREDCRLSWSIDTDAEVQGVLYTLWIDIGDELSKTVRGLEKPEYVIGENDLEDVASGEFLSWSVEAIVPGGERILSDTFETRLE